MRITKLFIEDDIYPGERYQRIIYEDSEQGSRMSSREELPSMTIEVNTPDGVLYYTICESENGAPIKVISTFGKAGSALAAWAQAVDILVNMLLEKETPLMEIIDGLSNITHNRAMKTISGVRVGSGPEGIVVAFLEYKRQLHRRNQVAI